KNTYVAAYALTMPEERTAGRAADVAPAERERSMREAIARDPSNAVALDIPKDASRDLLSLIAVTASDVRNSLAAQGNMAPREDAAIEFFILSEEAKERQKEVEARLMALDLGGPEAQHARPAEFRDRAGHEMLGARTPESDREALIG